MPRPNDWNGGNFTTKQKNEVDELLEEQSVIDRTNQALINKGKDDKDTLREWENVVGDPK